MKFMYTLGIYLYSALILIASLFSKKAKLMVDGRKGWKHKLDQLKGEEVIWFHAASLGEFEQGKPVLDAIYKEKGNRKVLLTFFSPSGYEIRKTYEKADLVIYLPMDTKSNVKLFLKKIDIKVAVFVKYEFWFNYLIQLDKQKIPTVFFSVIFRKDQMFFKPFGKWFLNRLKRISKFFVQNQESKTLLNQNGLTEVEVIGDTRFDSVLETKKLQILDPKVEEFLNGNPCVVFGSTWPSDHALIVSFINAYEGNTKFIIAPHEINEHEVLELESLINKKTSRYLNNQQDGDVLIVNTIGKLKHLYQYAICSYIGGGFGKGIHNTLEAAAQSQFVFFGPNYSKFQEAKDLIHKGIGSSISDQIEFNSILNMLISQPEFREEVSDRSNQFIHENSGASQVVINYLQNILDEN